MRALWLVLLTASAFAQTEAGFVSLFDGKTLQGWTLYAKGSGRGYIVENGMIVCPPDGGGNLYTEKEFSDFILRLEYRMEPGGNNGIGIRAPLAGDAAYSGMEIQILDDSHERYKGRLKPTQYTASIYDVIPARPGFPKPAGEWNTYEIMAKGRHIRVTLNGVIVTDADLDIVKEPEILKRHPGLARTGGHVGFLGHGSRVEFRNIRIKEL